MTALVPMVNILSLSVLPTLVMVEYAPALIWVKLAPWLDLHGPFVVTVMFSIVPDAPLSVFRVVVAVESPPFQRKSS